MQLDRLTAEVARAMGDDPEAREAIIRGVEDAVDGRRTARAALDEQLATLKGPKGEK
jgi:hypothetical protein